MFFLLARILLWLFLVLLVWYLLMQLVPRKWLQALGAIVLLFFVGLAFLQPTNETALSIWDLLAIPLKPLGLVVVLLGLALKDGIEDVNGRLVAVSLSVLLLFSIPLVGELLTQRLEQDAYTISVENPLDARADAIVLLGWNTTRNPVLGSGRDRIEATEASDRIVYAAELFREEPVNQIIVSAGPRRDLQNTEANPRVEANDVQALLVRLGIPTAQITLETEGVDIHSSAVNVREILSGPQPRILLVASAYHLRRAAQTFLQEGFDVYPRATDFSVVIPVPEEVVEEQNLPERRLRTRDFVPSLQGLDLTTRAITEFLARIYYFLRGWWSMESV
jgi:uncharacterized SAM-binding protein YcdF (DUF218 family)